MRGQVRDEAIVGFVPCGRETCARGLLDGNKFGTDGADVGACSSGDLGEVSVVITSKED